MELSPSCLAVLEAHQWPGNVRELQNTIERAVIMSELGAPIIPASLAIGDPPAAWSAAKGESAMAKQADALLREDVVVTPIPATGSKDEGKVDVLRPLDEVEKRHILEVLQACNGNRTKAADTLGISIRTLRNKLHEYRANGQVAPVESGELGAE
jgi:DNA-binding NtrC family response regulator